MTVYRTAVGRAVPHWTGWVPFADGLEITAAPLVDQDVEGLFARLTYRDAVAVAGAMGARLLTMAEHDLLAKTGRKLRPIIKTPGAEMASLRYAKEHDAELADQMGKWDGVTPLVNAGKQWVYGAAPGRALNYGWWSSAAPNGRMWQTLGTRHDDGHTDYSQLTMLVRQRSSGFIGKAVATFGEAVKDAAGKFAALMAPSLADAHLERALAELGISEIPGTRSNPRIDEYLAVAMRGGKRLGLRGDDQFSWCACFFSWCGLPPGMTPCAAVSEMVTQAKATGRWRPADTFHDPKPGDAVLFKRSGQDPRTGGLGHIARVKVAPDASGNYVTVGGNEGSGVVKLTERNLSAPTLIGWFVYDA